LEFGRAFLEAGRPCDRGPILRNSETLLFDWDTAEADRAFEMTTFGTVVHAINARRDDAAGLYAAEFPQWSGPGIFHAVPVLYIDAIQKQTFWDDHSVSEITEVLKVPKIGVPAIYSRP
jgi:hypothetical protein